ncbi:MAG TPA: LamG-like jellyroll fold domain-containing protein, partial [Candidatus Eisenbacteria bacterium]
NGGATGSIDLTASGGTPPYSYSWADGPTTEDRTNLLAGSYSVTVTDANGCTASTTVAISEPSALVLSQSHVDVLCNGGATGSIDLTASGGTPPYSYSWADGPTTEDRAGLSAGSYSVTVTDGSGCTASTTVAISEPSALVLSESHVDVLCNGGATGSIDLSVSGGTSGYSYAWADGPTTEDRTGLTAGSYSVTVTDANGCTAGTTVAITEQPIPPPGNPTGLTAVAPDGVQVQLSWVDNANSEDGFKIERSAGQDTTFALIATVGPDVTSYVDGPLRAMTDYCYRVSAVNCSGVSAPDSECITTQAGSCHSLDFDPNGSGTRAYVHLGNPSALRLPMFTIELWIRRDGAGIGTSTGSGGIPDAVPLVTKGRAESQGQADNINYFLGLRQSDAVLCADFGEGPEGPSPGLNHPVAGITPIAPGAWHHVATTYDGSTWKLYLDGNLETQLAVNRPVADASPVMAAVSSSLDSGNVPAGYFDGAIDEVRIWNFARSASEIQNTMSQSLYFPTPGLVGNWRLDEATGVTAFGTAGTGINGTIVGSADTNWMRVTCGSWAVGVESQPISELALRPVSPNPTKGIAHFSFAIPENATVKLEIVDVLGRRVGIVTQGDFPAGVHHVMWNATGSRGIPVSAGMYFVRFTAAGRVITKRFVIVR